MMEYKVTRAAPDELKHWGIKGQKWGVRRYQNADGTLTEEGKLRYRSGEEQKKLADTIKNHGGSNETLAKIPQIQATLASVKDTAKKLGEAQNELDKYENDWYSRKNPEAYDKYTRKLAEEMTSKYDHSTKEEDIQIRLDLIRNDDLDQGESFQMYLKDNPSAMKAFKAAQEKESAAYKAHKEAIASYTKEWLGDHANDQMKLWSYGGYTQYAPVSKRLEGMIYAESMKGLRHSEGGTHMSDYIIHRDIEYLEHFGIKGQKWGVRRYENEDGTLTEEGRARYRSDAEKARKEIGDASRTPGVGMGTNEAAYLKNKMFGGKKYRELDKAITKSTKKEVRAYNEAYDEKRKAAEEYGRPDESRGFFESIFYNKSKQKETVRELNERHKQAGKELADAIASVGIQYINENFSDKQRERAKAFVYATFVQGNDREIRTQFGQING